MNDPSLRLLLVCSLGLAGGLVLAACTNGDSEPGGAAPRATSSTIPTAPPRALGPGAASLEVPARARPTPHPEEHDPFAPFLDPPEGGVAPPPGKPLPL